MPDEDSRSHEQLKLLKSIDFKLTLLVVFLLIVPLALSALALMAYLLDRLRMQSLLILLPGALLLWLMWKFIRKKLPYPDEPPRTEESVHGEDGPSPVSGE